MNLIMLNINSKNFIGREISYSGKRYGEKAILKDKLEVDLSLKMHKALIAMTGSGKSYGAGVIIEELINSCKGFGLLIIDPLGVYSSLDVINKGKEINIWNEEVHFKEIVPRSLQSEVYIPLGAKKENPEGSYYDTFSLSAMDLNADIISDAFGIDAFDPQMNLFRDVQCDFNEGQVYDVNKLIDKIFMREDYVEKTRSALIGRLKALRNAGIISSKPTDITKMIIKDKVVVLNLSQLDEETSRMVVNFLLDKIMKLRKKIKSFVEQAIKTDKRINVDAYIPPVQLIIDEAHIFTEKNNHFLNLAIKTGRNSGLTLTLITQNFDLPKNVSSNVIQFFIGQLIDSEDIDRIKKRLPISDEEKKTFPSDVINMPNGCFFYANLLDKSFKRFKFRPRQTRHASQTEIFDEENYLIIKKNIIEPKKESNSEQLKIDHAQITLLSYSKDEK
jgi:DNA helicase HerA-like ATPase